MIIRYNSDQLRFQIGLAVLVQVKCRPQHMALGRGGVGGVVGREGASPALSFYMIQQPTPQFEIGSIYNSMKKYTFLQCSAPLSQLQARLDKNSYLSRSSLPNGSDAKVFLLFQKLMRIPRKTTHPNLYHWYILMKQFSTRTVEFWRLQAADTDEDRLIHDYILQQTNSAQKENSLAANNHNLPPNTLTKNHKTLSTASTPKNGNKSCKIDELNQHGMSRYNLITTSLKLISSECPTASTSFRGEVGSPTFEIEYVMEMQLKEKSQRVHGLKQRLQQQRLQLISLQQQQGSVRVVFRIEAQYCQRLKDKISKWEQISNLRFRKQKRFNIKSENKSERIISNNDIGIATTN